MWARVEHEVSGALSAEACANDADVDAAACVIDARSVVNARSVACRDIARSQPASVARMREAVTGDDGRSSAA